MGAATSTSGAIPRASAPWKGLPARVKVLYITTPDRTGGWLAEAFAADSASEVILEEAVGTAAGLTRLRDEAFDAVLVAHDPEQLNSLDLVEGYRAGGADEPIVVLGTEDEAEMAALCYEVGADGYLSIHTRTTRNLLWVVARAIQRHELVRENRIFRQAEQARLQREHEEARRLLAEQRALLGPEGREARAESRESRVEGREPRVEEQASEPSTLDSQLSTVTQLSTAFAAHYRELLQVT